MSIELIAERIGIYLARRVISTYETRLVHLEEQISLLQRTEAPPLPPEPRAMGIIYGWELDEIALKTFGCRIPGGPGDARYALTSVSEVERFLAWYDDRTQYTPDDFDCEDFAWLMRAKALQWMHGEFMWGYVEASGQVDRFTFFPNHGFNWIVDWERRVYFCDPLALAAPARQLMPAYKVECYGMVKA